MKKLSVWLKNDISLLLIRILFVYFLLAIGRVSFLLVNQESLGEIAWREIPSIVHGMMVFDTISVIYSNGILVLLYLLPFRFRYHPFYRRGLDILYVLVNSVIIILNQSDAVYFDYIKKRISAEELIFLNNDNNLTLLYQFALENLSLVVFALLLMTTLIIWVRKLPSWSLSCAKQWHWYAINLSCILIAIPLMIGGIRGGFSRAVRPLAMSNAAQYANNNAKASLILSNPFCLIRTLGKPALDKTVFFTPEELKNIYSPFHYPKHSAINLGKKNIVVFVLESFSSEHSAFLHPELYPDGKGYTPFLDSLMRESLCFHQAYANGRKSIDALPSVLTSMPSLKTPFVLLPQALSPMKGLPAMLVDKGYSSHFFCGSQANSMGFGAFASIAGIQHTYMREEYEKAKGKQDFDGYWGIWDHAMFRFMAESFNSFQQPFFASIFSLTSHHPYVVPESYVNRLRKGEIPIQRSASYTDQALKDFFAYARKQPWYSNTIFAFTADHVATFSYSTAAQKSVEGTHIIMAIYAPGTILKKQEYTITQQNDLMPTLLGLIGNKKPFFAMGRDVLNEPNTTPMALNHTKEFYQGIFDSCVLHFDGQKLVAAYIKSDVMLQHNLLKRPQTSTVQDLPKFVQSAEKQLKARLQQYYEHIQKMQFIAPDN